MRRILFIICSVVLLLLLINIVYYRALYNKQINYIVELLDRQAKIVGSTVDRMNNGFLSDLNEFNTYSSQFIDFFNDEQGQTGIIERMKLFFSRYQDFVTAIKFQDTNRNLFSLRRDTQTGEWLEQSIALQQQPEIRDKQTLLLESDVYQYYLPVVTSEGGKIIGNIVVSLDYRGFFNETFSTFNLKDHQWQWVLSDSGNIVFDNFEGKIEYLNSGEIAGFIDQGVSGKLTHDALIDGKRKEIISLYYSTHLLERDFGIIFSAPTEFFHKFILRNAILIISATLVLVLVLVYVFLRYIRSGKKEVEKLSASETMLLKLIDEMPAGIVIVDETRKIIKANNLAATLYGKNNGEELTGSHFPDPTVESGMSYFLTGSDGTSSGYKLVRITNNNRETILVVNSLPVNFRGKKARIEIHVDVTFLESARRQEARANSGKTEYLKRVSFELRTPLTGIIGMSDLLKGSPLPAEAGEMIEILQKSTEVILGIADEILDLSGIESGILVIDEKPLNLRDEIKYCSDLASLDKNEGVTMRYEIDDTVPVSIIGDRYRIRQIITNLLVSSVANTPEGEISLLCSAEKGNAGLVRLKFEIRDSGRSFSKDELEKIYGNVISLDQKVPSAGGASGLGTVIARHLIELMGGSFRAECPSGLKGGSGTKVNFTINTYSNDRVMKEIDRESIKTFDNIRTLIISSSQHRDEEILGMMHKMGLTVSVTTFTRTTINQIKANISYADERYKLIVILGENELNGFDVAQQLWENDLADKFLIFLICSNMRKGDLHKSVSMGIDQCFVKPVDYEMLAKAIRSGFPKLEVPEVAVDISRVRKDLNILLVEDNKMNQKVLQTMLESLGFTCDLAEDGYDGVLKARSRHYDLIFMDLVLPEIDGYEAARKIVADDKTAIIVAFTADNMPESRKKAELSGIVDYISKPVRIEALIHLLSRHFNS